jgi:hypothetical protein
MPHTKKITGEFWNHTGPAQGKNAQPRNLRRSFAAVFAGIATVVALSLGTDQILHELHVYPPWGEPMRDSAPNLLALTYRSVFNVVGGYVTAHLAPRSGMRHVIALGIVGSMLGLLGAIATIPMNIGPAWYPIGLVVTALPGCWLGGVLWNGSGGRRSGEEQSGPGPS